jgi:carboxyl-terminal processing protease
MRRKKLLIIIMVLVAVNFVLGMQVQEKLAESDTEGLEQLALIPEAMSIIQNNYVEKVDTETLVQGALRGMLNSLDLHSQYLPPPAVKSMEVDTSGTFGGLGIEITRTREGFVTVVSPIVGTPAYRAGLMAGDRIVKIDDEILKDPDLNDVVSKLRGEPGTKVTVTVLRGHSTIKQFTIARAVIKVPSIVEAKIIEDSIGYVKITQFQERTATELKRELTGLAESQGMSALILDLRDNPGGLLVSAVEVADVFLPEGQVIVSTRGRRQAQNHEYRARDTQSHALYPLAVLINKGSASGSEIVAGAIKDQKRGVIIGENSYGKASVQTILRLGRQDDRMALRLTTAKYYTPSGVSIVDKGIEPHVMVKETPEQELKRRTQRYKKMEEALKESENEETKEEGAEPSAESEKPPILPEELEELIGKTAEEEDGQEFIDVQLQEAVRILKAIRAIGGGSSIASRGSVRG